MFEDWKNILVEVMELEDIDPWNIDIVKLADRYLKYIQRKGVDFKISGNVVLAASILLRMKSDLLLQEKKEMPEKIAEIVYKPPIPDIKPVVRRIPRRRVTFVELVTALKKALEIEKREERVEEPIILDATSGFEIEGVYEKIMRLAKEGKTRFSILAGKNRKKVIETLVPLLHLEQNRVIELLQNELFDEIYIIIKNE